MDFRDFLLILTTLGCVFLFDGTPDVWDALHYKAMRTIPQSECQ
jgi:hypothetical protein